MKIDTTFTVHAPIDDVWAALFDVDRVTACVPGAQVLAQIGEDAYRVGMKVRVGPVSMQYRGQVEVVERDEEQRRAVMRGKGKETRGQGTADATVELRLTGDDVHTQGTVHTDLKLSGRAAAMGQGIIGDVAQQIVEQFSANLQQMLVSTADSTPEETMAGTPEDESRSGDTVAEATDTAAAGSRHGGVIEPPEQAAPGESPVEQTRGDEDMTEGQIVGTPGSGTSPDPASVSVPPREAAVSGGAQSEPGARASDRVAAGSGLPGQGISHPAARGPSGRPPWQPSPAAADTDDDGGLDVLPLAGRILAERLRDPRALLGLLAVVALVAYRLGRRGSRRAPTGFDVDALERLEKFFASLRDR